MRRRLTQAMKQRQLYLLHFQGGKVADRAGHYLGSSDDPDARFEQHISGRGSPLVKAAVEAGLEVQKVRTWPGDRTTERLLKKRKNLAALCPICRKAYLAKKAERARAARARIKDNPTPQTENKSDVIPF